MQPGTVPARSPEASQLTTETVYSVYTPLSLSLSLSLEANIADRDSQIFIFHGEDFRPHYFRQRQRRFIEGFKSVTLSGAKDITFVWKGVRDDWSI